MPRRFFCFLIVFTVVLACSHDDTASAHPRNASSSSDDGVPPRPSVIAASSQPYHIVPVSVGGTITGSVDFEGTVPAATVVHPTSDQSACGTSVMVKNIAVTGTRVGGAVVWLTDIHSGKALPIERRFELTNDACTLDPYVQVISTSATLNVSNDDRTLHTNRFINVGTGQIVGIAPFNDDGEVVPVDKFAEPAEIEVVCEQHPWTHAWIAVLDHPYFAKTTPAGTFSINGIPAGKYHIRAWHPALGFADDSVTVTAGLQTSVAFRIRPGATNGPAVPTQVPTESVRPPVSNAPAVPILPTASSTPATTPKGPPPPR
jgi:polysaccharide lyase family 4-like protein